MENVITKSTVKCSFCGFAKEEDMPLNACVHFYECTQCGKMLKPKKVNAVFSVLMEVLSVHRNK